MYLENINSPADVKKLSVGELTSLCAEMREALIQKLSVHGGHVGPNLGSNRNCGAYVKLSRMEC